MSINAASLGFSTLSAAASRHPAHPKAPNPMTFPGADKDPTATGKPDPAPLRKDLTGNLQATLLQAQEAASRPAH